MAPDLSFSQANASANQASHLKQVNLPHLNRHGFFLTPCRSAVMPPPTCFPPQFFVHRNGILI